MPDATTWPMTCRTRLLAALRYEPVDRMPLLHFGYWRETLRKWATEGHISSDLAEAQGDGNEADRTLDRIFGFDHNYAGAFGTNTGLRPGFEPEVVATFPDGTKHVRNHDGVVCVQKPEAGSIPAEIEHTLTDRASWEKHYAWRYKWTEERIDLQTLARVEAEAATRELPYGLFCGSLYGHVRNILGVEGSSYLYVDDEELFDEITTTVADICYRNVAYVLEHVKPGVFDFGHFWEDICFKNGPLIAPQVFTDKVAPGYKRITDLLKTHGIDIVSLDCDGCIDALLPIWLENGVNTMFPIEVGTWQASIAPWRTQYGQDLRGVGGMNKTVFARDKAAVDAEIERLRPLVDLGGYVPCPDHRIAPDAKFDLVQYYCEGMRKVFG